MGFKTTISNAVKGSPFLYKRILNFKHALWRRQTEKTFIKYAGKHDIAKLQLGAGQNELRGWFNTDYFPRPGISFLDVTKVFPFKSNSFQLAFSEHHIEHITYLQAQFMLDELYRVLQPGGIVKINTPDLRKYLSSYINQQLRSTIIEEHAKNWIYSGFAHASTYIPVNEAYEAHFVNDIFLNYEHRFIYDADALSVLLTKAGFSNIVHNAEATRYEEFLNIESHVSDFDKQFTLYIVAQKPLK